jgi:hypothetical protein
MLVVMVIWHDDFGVFFEVLDSLFDIRLKKILPLPGKKEEKKPVEKKPE